MLYDKKIHLPQRMEKMLEYFEAGDIGKLETGKTIVKKILYDNKDFITRMEMIEIEHDKRRDPLLESIIEKQKKLEDETKKLDKIEHDYYESIVGLVMRTVDKIPSPVSDTQVVDE